MRLGVLKSIGHNIADSVACGQGFLLGYYPMDIFGEASRSPEGSISVDFLAGTTGGSMPSDDLAQAIALYSEKALPALCEKHGVRPSAFRTLTARYGVDRVYGPHFTVTVEDDQGRRSVDRFVGIPGARLRSYRSRRLGP